MKCECDRDQVCPVWGIVVLQCAREKCRTSRKFRKMLRAKKDAGTLEGSTTPPDPNQVSTHRLTCLHRSAAPIDYAGCGCARKHVYACEHADLGGKCTWHDMQGCELWEED